jgi:hypothetical protein
MDYEIANYMALQLGRPLDYTSITGSFFIVYIISSRRHATTRLIVLHFMQTSYKIVY